MPPVVSRLQVAPVKALAPVEAAELRLDRDGVAEDRRLFLLDAAGKVLTIRQAPALGSVVPVLDLAAGALELLLPDGGRVAGALDDLGEEVTATLYGRERPGRVVRGPFAAALSAVAERPVRLVLAPRTGVGWDEGPVSLVSRASTLAVEPPSAPARRFRMLVEVDGPAAYAEDGWVGQELALGAAVVRVTHPLERCVVIEHDPTSGSQDWRGLKRLVADRGAVTLGVIAEVVEPGTVRLGDAVAPR
ncbi:uncharacterized protein YcbX [Motilibacter rhizosphaerae]|uniref:Uncharacterized protein YcbX n=1 Tax=Motilibacter rhizosphaerae TaxID=598652 RepID=A0A4Q7NTF6_9ACTN|nr:MOSC N-terminal beta barrel domain-containing protein [Motilibacter rhizosphaerae]RZS89672.1 uncharacterized protein YcbX [Motilibacter rhizosphaerae]